MPVTLLITGLFDPNTLVTKSSPVRMFTLLKKTNKKITEVLHAISILDDANCIVLWLIPVACHVPGSLFIKTNASWHQIST